MKKIASTSTLLAIALLGSTAVFAETQSGLYVGADLGANTTLNSAYGVSYGGNAGYRYENIAVEGLWQSVGHTGKTSTLDSSSIMTTGTTVNVLFFSSENDFLKIGYGNMANKLEWTTTSLVGGTAVKTNRSSQFDTTAYVIGLGGETKSAINGVTFRTGVDMYILKSAAAGTSDPDTTFNFYFSAQYYF